MDLIIVGVVTLLGSGALALYNHHERGLGVAECQQANTNQTIEVVTDNAKKKEAIRRAPHDAGALVLRLNAGTF
jgi:hypothetical protein